MSRAIQICCIAVMATACAEQVTLESADRKEVLTYQCGHFEPLANSPSGEAIVREHSLRIVRQALDREDERTVDRLVEAYEGPTFQLLEEVVVGYSCKHGVTPRGPVFPETGSAARDVELPTLTLEAPYDDGPMVKLDDYTGSVVVVDVFGIWCKTCLEKYPATAAIAQEYKKKGVVFFGILLISSPRQSAKWFRENGGLAYPFLVDRKHNVTREWRLGGAPAMFVIDQHGLIAGRCLGCQSGPLSVDSLPAFLDSLLLARGHAP
jgi:peroxiredoxin